MDAAAKEELQRRIREQGWTQGSGLPARHDLFLADLRDPLTVEAEQLRDAKGEAPLAVVHHESDSEPGMIVISQRCDLVADPDTEPLCEAIPLTRWPHDRELPAPNSARYFVVDGERRLVADQTRRLEFEKTILPDAHADQLLLTEDMALRFRAWCGRRYTRVPLPDDFNLTVGRAISYVLGKRRRADAPELEATYPWRVLREQADDGSIDVHLIVPYNEQHAAAGRVPAFVEAVIEAAEQRLVNEHERAGRWAAPRGVTIRPHRIAGHEAVRADVLTMRDIHDSEAIDLDYLTYRGDEVRGELSSEDHLA